MARLPRVMEFAAQHAMPVVAVKDLVRYRREKT